MVDSWKVYDGGPLSSSAIVRAFEAAVGVLDKVIVAEIQAPQNHLAAIATAANAAFDAGSVVVAAAGNYGEEGIGSVRAPANAKKVLGIGAVDVATLELEQTSSRGPTSDMRIKPDLLGPTNVLVASKISDWGLKAYGGTSAATPFVAGAAYNFRNYFFDPVGTASVEPGRVYALMLMTGPQVVANNDTGLGLPKLEPVGSFWSMTADVVNGSNVDVSFNVTGSFNSSSAVKVAIWWPEDTSFHNQINLQLIRPNGTVAASSTTAAGVFKKVRTASGLVTGTWKVRLHGATVSATQRVYVAVHKR